MDDIMHATNAASEAASEEESDGSDTTIIPSSVSKKDPQPKCIQTIDAFVRTAEQIAAESEAILTTFPGSYVGEVEVQHLTVQDTVHAAETFLYKKPHIETDAITQVVKKLWHINNRYNYCRRQAEK